MKTISINSRANLLTVLGVVGVLGALYFYRRQGGTVSSLITKGKDMAGRVRDQATESYNSLTDAETDASESLTSTKASMKDAAREAKANLKSEASSVH